MGAPITLSLGGQSYIVRPLTLGQLRELAIGVAGAGAPPGDPSTREAVAFDRMVAAVSTALRRDNPDIAPAALYELEIGLDDLRTAYRAILVHSGLVPSGEAAAAPSNGATSTGS